MPAPNALHITNFPIGDIVHRQSWTLNNIANHVLIGTAYKLSWRFIPPIDLTITDLNLNLNIAGVVTATNFVARIETESGGNPSGTLVGTATAEWAGPAAAGWIGDKALGSSAALSARTPYHITVLYSSGTAPDVSNYIQGRNQNSYTNITIEVQKQYNGATWALRQTSEGLFLLKDSGGLYFGHPLTTTLSNGAIPSVTDIYGTNRMGMRLKVGAQCQLRGVWCRIITTGSPSDLEIAVYEGATEKYSMTYTAASLALDNAHLLYAAFATPVTLSAATNLYVVFRQAADGGSAANYYRLHWQTFAELTSILPADVRFLYGTGDDPTALTVHSTAMWGIVPHVDDPAVDLIGGGSGLARIIGG